MAIELALRAAYAPCHCRAVEVQRLFLARVPPLSKLLRGTNDHHQDFRKGISDAEC